MEGEAKKRGRHPKAAADRKSANMKFRTREDLREMLEAAAERSGFSVSEECERRLFASFTADDLRLIVQQEVFSAVRDALAVALAVRSDIPGERTEDEPSQRPQ